MKKLAIVLAALLLACVFVGCGAIGEKALLGNWDVYSVQEADDDEAVTQISSTNYGVSYVRYVFEEDNKAKLFSTNNKSDIDEGKNFVERKWFLDDTGTTLTITYADGKTEDGVYTVDIGVKEMTWTQVRPDRLKDDVIVLKKVTE